MTEFDDNTLRRIAKAVRKSERSRDPGTGHYYNPPIFKYVLNEDVVLADTVEATIWCIDDSAAVDLDAILNFADNYLLGRLAGTYGRCHWFQGQYWLLDGAFEQLESFTMLSNWVGTVAAARFTLIDGTVSYGVGIVEDKLGIFTDQLHYGQAGLAIRTTLGRHHVIQAKCAQTTVTPPTFGCCVIPRSPGLGGDISAQTTQAICTELGGEWTAGACP